MKKSGEFAIDAKGIKVLIIIFFGLFVTLTCVLFHPEEPKLLFPTIVNGLCALALNRIIAPPKKRFIADNFQRLRAITEFLVVLALLGALVEFFLYSKWFALFHILMAPAILLSYYLVLHYAFGNPKNNNRPQ